MTDVDHAQPNYCHPIGVLYARPDFLDPVPPDLSAGLLALAQGSHRNEISFIDKFQVRKGDFCQLWLPESQVWRRKSNLRLLFVTWKGILPTKVSFDFYYVSLKGTGSFYRLINECKKKLIKEKRFWKKLHDDWVSASKLW